MVKELISWFEDNKQLWRDRHVEFEVRKPESGGLEKANVRLKSRSILASITAWEEGALELIVMDNKTGEELISEDRNFQHPEDMRRFLGGIRDRLNKLL
jgi:hypothetical protein